MSEADIHTSSLVLNSVAERLRAAWFRQTGITRAVTELVREYLGIHTNMSRDLATALWDPNSRALDLLRIQTDTLPTATVANDGNFTQPTTMAPNDEKLKEAA